MMRARSEDRRAHALSRRATRRRARPVIARSRDALVVFAGVAFAMLASLAALGCDHPPPAPTRAPVLVPSPMPTPTPVPVASTSPTPAPMPDLSSAPVATLCMTEGDATPSGSRATIREPATRGFLTNSTGDAATLAFTYRGRSHSVAALASGDTRTQLGIKLRAQDSCNVIYVMWRIEPTSEIVVQTKRNTAHAHRDCGAEGYTRVRPSLRASPPPLGVPEWSSTARDAGESIDAELAHTLEASIVEDVLEVRADGRLVWRGTLPETARDLQGPVGFRTDNVDVDLELRAPHREAATAERCPRTTVGT